jgi:hypothetical protein
MRDDVIYVNPASLYRYGRTIQVNPLEIKNEEERYVVVMTFVNTLYNLYSDSWGPRLETVLRNAANALVETEYNTIGNISKMMTDESSRDIILQGVASKNVKHFWREIFQKQYSKDAGSSAYNKIDKILTTPTIAAMFDTRQSSIQIKDVINDKKMLIVDLSTGASDDIAQFLGTIFLNMLYVEAKKRIDFDDGDEIRENPFYVYVDEAHMFSNRTMGEMLRALRKFGIKMTIATQTCNSYDKSFADEITGVCKTRICGKCDHNTANILRASMPISPTELQQLPSYTFAYSSSEGNIPVSGIFKSRPIPSSKEQSRDWRDIAEYSIKKYGKKVSLVKYMPKTSNGMLTNMNPLEATILHTLYYSNRDMNKNEIIENTLKEFDVEPREVISALVDVLVNQLQYVTKHYPKDDDGDKTRENRYSVSKKAHHSYFSHAAAGRRAGSELHIATIFAIMNYNMQYGRYCIPDLGDKTDAAADLLIIEPKTYKTTNNVIRKDPHLWNDDTILAVEIETDPGKHMDQVVKNWQKNHNHGYRVWFLVFEEKHKEKIITAFDAKYINRKDYQIDIISGESMFSNMPIIPDMPYLASSHVGKIIPEAKYSATPYNRVFAPSTNPPMPHLTQLEATIYEMVGDGLRVNLKDILDRIPNNHNMTENDIYYAIGTLIKNRVLKWNTIEQKRQRDNLDGNGIQTTYSRVKILEKTNMHAKNSPQHINPSNDFNDRYSYCTPENIKKKDNQKQKLTRKEKKNISQKEQSKITHFYTSQEGKHYRESILADVESGMIGNLEEYDDQRLQSMLYDQSFSKQIKDEIVNILQKRGHVHV